MNVSITNASREFSVREKLQVTSLNKSEVLDRLVEEDASFIFTPSAYAELFVENENAKADGDKEYTTYIFIDTAGNMYRSGSRTLYEEFRRIFDIMEGSGEEYQIEVVKRPSNNRPGKYFMTCNIL